ncbi:MAG: hypothetical protein K1X85_04815 [Ignavibacteria bacterium]|nr:hypothetical protein [Ignavibacteria bacterium]
MSESTRNVSATPEQIESGKTMAVVSYIIFFIPLLMDDMRKNPFVMYHTEQSIVLLLLNIAAGIVGTLTCGIGLILYIPWLILLIMGIMNAANGQMKPLPVIGQFGEKFGLAK